MKQPTEEDFKAHALTMAIKHNQPGSVAFGAACIEFGYSMAVGEFCKDVAKNTKELKEHRESNNAPR